MTDHEMPPLPKRLRDMTSERYNFLLESFWGFWHVTGSMSHEDAEAEMNPPWFFSSWEPRIDRMMEDDGLAAHVQRPCTLGLPRATLRLWRTLRRRKAWRFSRRLSRSFRRTKLCACLRLTSPTTSFARS